MKTFGDTVLYSNKVYYFEEIHRCKTDMKNLKNMNDILVEKNKWLDHRV